MNSYVIKLTKEILSVKYEIEKYVEKQLKKMVYQRVDKKQNFG